jgi:hypothetical protein
VQLGFSYWGFCESHFASNVIETPDGGRFTRPILAECLSRFGVKIICLQQKRETNPLPFLKYAMGFPKIDALFIEWRWQTYKNYKYHPLHEPKYYEPDWDRQQQLLSHYHDKTNVPIIIWDTDLKMTRYDEARWPKAVILDPCLVPKKILKDRISFPYFTDGRTLAYSSYLTNRHIYVGSNYERYNVFEKYYFEPAKKLKGCGIETYVRGNWLNYSVERPEQEEMVNKYKEFITFASRNRFIEGMSEIAESICTTHIGKEEYMKRGLITPRFVEAIACGTPGLVPIEFCFNRILGKSSVVATSDDVVGRVQFLKSCTAVERQEIVEMQLKSLLNNSPMSNVKNSVKLLLEIIGGGKNDNSQ